LPFWQAAPTRRDAETTCEFQSTPPRSSRIVEVMDDIPVSVLIGAILFAWVMWAVLFWSAIAILERHNPFNTFGWALVWSAVELAVSVGLAGMSYTGWGLAIAWIVFLARLLLGRYELGALHAVGVVIVTVVGPYFVFDAFVSFVGSSETRLMIALYGIPAVVLVVWKWPRRASDQPSNLPPARVTRFWRRRPAKAPVPVPVPVPVLSAPVVPAPIVPTPVAPIVPTPVLAAPVAATPPAPPAAIAPPSQPSPSPPRADGEPSFLR
jgi:hypothetical protein